MEYLVTLVRTEGEDQRDWTDATGPEENRGGPATGTENPGHLDLLGLLGRRVRKENLNISLAISRIYRVSKEETVRRVSEARVVGLVLLV